MKSLVRFIAISFATIAFAPQGVLAEQSIPITGTDAYLSQYICQTTPGVKTYGVKVVLANGTIKNISVAAAKMQIEKQIDAVTKKILNTTDLLTSAETPAQREKLKTKISSLRTQRESQKFIKKQLTLCGKAKLEFNASNIPVLLTNTVSNPSFSLPLNHFMFGFKFTVPKNYKRDAYCVSVTNATTTPNNIGGILYPETGELETEGYKNCRNFGAPVGELCVIGLGNDEAMIILTQGAFEERSGNCSSMTNCSLNELRNLLTNFYTNTRLASFRPGSCNE